MKLLLLYLHQPSPPHSGGRIRSWEILKFLAHRHQVTLVYFGDSNAMTAPNPVSALCDHTTVVRYPDALSPQDIELGKNTPYAGKQYYTTEMAQAIAALAPHSFDLVVVDSLYMSVYRELLPTKTVLLEQNIESQILKQHETAQAENNHTSRNCTWRMLAFHENRIWNTFPLRVVVSSEDK